MAKLNGVEMKTFKNFRGHEGEPLAQATIYIDGKKAGFWSQDSWGGGDQYEDRAMEATIGERAKAFQKGCPKDYMFYDVMDSADCFMGTLLHLCDCEKAYKTFAKKGYPYMVAVDNGEQAYYTAFKIPVTAEKVKADGVLKDQIYKNGNPNIYFINSLGEFDIKVDEEHQCPMWLLRD